MKTYKQFITERIKFKDVFTTSVFSGTPVMFEYTKHTGFDGYRLTFVDIKGTPASSQWAKNIPKWFSENTTIPDKWVNMLSDSVEVIIPGSIKADHKIKDVIKLLKASPQ